MPVNIIQREFIFFWYFFTLQFSQIAGYWALGMIIGSLISVFGKHKLHAMLASIRKKNLGVLGIIPASLIGIASPLCMYGTIPIAASLAQNAGGKDGPSLDGELAAFMMSSILLNPQLIMYSAALGKAALIIRLVSCFLCGISAGLLIRCLCKGKRFFNFTGFGEEASRDTDPNLLLRLIKNLWRNVKATGPFFLLGITLSVLFQRYVPPHAFADFFGRHRAFGLLMAATMGVPLYVCGGGTIPLLITWMHSGMSLGSASAFMISGPAMKITNLGAVKIILGIKHFALYIAYAVVFALLTGFLVDAVNLGN